MAIHPTSGARKASGIHLETEEEGGSTGEPQAQGRTDSDSGNSTGRETRRAAGRRRRCSGAIRARRRGAARAQGHRGAVDVRAGPRAAREGAVVQTGHAALGV